MEDRLIKLEETLINLVSHVKNTHELINVIVKTTNENFEKIHIRLSNIESEVSKLSHETSTNFDNVDNKLIDIKDELSKINVTTRYEEEYQNLRIVQ